MRQQDFLTLKRAKMKLYKKRYKHFHRGKAVYIVLIITGLLLTGIILPGSIFSQQPTTFYRISYYKVVPGKEEVLHSMTKNVDAQVQQARIKAGAILGWYMYKLLSPAGTSADYDYMTVTIVKRYKHIFEPIYSFDSALNKTFSKKGAQFLKDYHSRLNESRKLVKEEIYAGIALADSSSKDGFQSKYIISDFMQPKPEKFGEYMKAEVDTFRIIHRERIKMGGDISQWACFSLMLPYDTKTGYSILTFNFYNDLDAITTSKYLEALKTTFPTVDLSRLFQSVASMRDNPRADLWQLVSFASPATK